MDQGYHNISCDEQISKSSWRSFELSCYILAGFKGKLCTKLRPKWLGFGMVESLIGYSDSGLLEQAYIVIHKCRYCM